MQPTLLATKLYIPTPRAGLVPRPRLTEKLRLALARDYRLILVSASTGFGKTNLVSQFISKSMENEGGPREKHPGPTGMKDRLHPSFAWLSLDEGDNDPLRFWTYAIAALQKSGREVGRSTLAQMQLSPASFVPDLLVPLINELSCGPAGSGQAQEDAGEPLILVLDDYQVISSPAIHESLLFLIEALPPLVRILLISRVDPPLPLGRLRAKGQLTEIRASDLCFTQAEAAQFLNQAMRLNLTGDDVYRLEARTEGWVAGLQLAALSLQNSQDPHAFIDAFTGSNRHVVDYLVEEVLSRQTEEVQEFLLCTSILERLTASLCDELLRDEGGSRQKYPGPTGRKDEEKNFSPHPSSFILEFLERSNLFLIPLDETRTWFRYHHLFGELLRSRVRQATPEWVQKHGSLADLHHRAAGWYEDNGFYGEAIHHTLAVPDFERTARLVESYGDSLWTRGELATLLGWLNALPEDVIVAHPRLCILNGWCRMLSGRVEQWSAIDAQLSQVEKRLLEPAGEAEPPQAQADLTRQELYGLVCAVRALANSAGINLGQAQISAGEASKYLCEHNLLWKGVALFCIGGVYTELSEVAAAAAIYEEAMRVNRAAGNPLLALRSAIYLAIQRCQQGQLAQVAEIGASILEYARGMQEKTQPMLAGAHLVIAQGCYEWNRLEEAREHLLRLIHLAKISKNIRLVAIAQTWLARVTSAQGDGEAALALLDHTEEIARQQNFAPIEFAILAAEKARLWLTWGKSDRLAGWAHSAAPEEELNIQRRSIDLTLARVWIPQARTEQAIDLLKRWREDDLRAGRMADVIETWVVEALAWYAAGSLAEALTALAEALTLGQPQKFMRVFLNEGAAIEELLLRLLRQGSIPSRVGAAIEPGEDGWKAYARQILASFQIQGKVQPAPAHPAQPDQPALELVEPLTRREIEILGLIVEGYSNPEIAGKLCLSIDTVKTHVKNIYGKLGVDTRSRAIAQARKLRLF